LTPRKLDASTRSRLASVAEPNAERTAEQRTASRERNAEPFAGSLGELAATPTTQRQQRNANNEAPTTKPPTHRQPFAVRSTQPTPQRLDASNS
jgi:hypothetical protein